MFDGNDRRGYDGCRVKATTHRYRGEGQFRRTKKWQDIRNAFNKKCIYCNLEPEPPELSCDRVIPKSKGGTAIFWNIVPACIKCNSSHNDLSIEQFMTLKDLDLKIIKARWLGAALQLLPRYFKLRKKEFSNVGRDFISRADYEFFTVIDEFEIQNEDVKCLNYWPLRYALKLLTN